MENYDSEQQYQPGDDDPVTRPHFAGKIIASIFQLLVFPLYGLIPLVLTIAAQISFKCNERESYEKTIKAAKVALKIGWILMAIESVLVIGGFIYLFYAMVTSGF